MQLMGRRIFRQRETEIVERAAGLRVLLRHLRAWRGLCDGAMPARRQRMAAIAQACSEAWRCVNTVVHESAEQREEAKEELLRWVGDQRENLQLEAGDGTARTAECRGMGVGAVCGSVVGMAVAERR